LKVPVDRLHLYPEDANARGEIAKAVRAAGHAHKRIILIFGNNICTNCDVLEAAFKSPKLQELSIKIMGWCTSTSVHLIRILRSNTAFRFSRGFPALAVLDSNGKLVFSQKQGEFADARWMAPDDILDFLNKWKPSASKN
jgi:hypothetical protein